MMMKKIFSILSFMLMFACCNLALTSCGSDDDDDETTENNVNSKIVGTWKEYDSQNPNSGESPLAVEASFTFNADGTYLRTLRNINYQGTDAEGYLMKLKGKYTVSNDKLTLNIEQSYRPIAAEDPYATQWQEEKWTETYTIEWLEGNTIMRLHEVLETGTSNVSEWKKVK